MTIVCTFIDEVDIDKIRIFPINAPFTDPFLILGITFIISVACRLVMSMECVELLSVFAVRSCSKSKVRLLANLPLS